MIIESASSSSTSFQNDQSEIIKEPSFLACDQAISLIEIDTSTEPKSPEPKKKIISVINKSVLSKPIVIPRLAIKKSTQQNKSLVVKRNSIQPKSVAAKPLKLDIIQVKFTTN